MSKAGNRLAFFVFSLYNAVRKFWHGGTDMKKNSTGRHIQNFAGLLCVLGCIFSFLGGLFFFSSGSMFIGLSVIVAGCYISWACTRCLKGFGELVDDTAETRETNDRILDVLESMYIREYGSDAREPYDAEPSGKPAFVETKVKGKNLRPNLIALIVLIVLFVLVVLGASTSSTEKPTATSTPTKRVVVTSAPTKTPYISATPKRTQKATAKPTSTHTAAPTSVPTATPFTVEHDDEYYATQDYIHQFLIDKGYEVQTIIGVPNIGRYEDDVPTDAYVNWYAYVKRNGKWQEFVVVLFNGEVSAIRPIK
jgi:hypothetical protein